MYPRKGLQHCCFARSCFSLLQAVRKTKTDTGSKPSSRRIRALTPFPGFFDSSDQSSDVSSDGLSTDSRGNLSDDITSSDSDNGYHTDRAIPTDSGNGNSGGSASVINYKTVSGAGLTDM
ncbi:MAG: hypothetical protein ACLR56_04525 [Oscillospiraceae bacterium]